MGDMGKGGIDNYVEIKKKAWVTDKMLMVKIWKKIDQGK